MNFSRIVFDHLLAFFICTLFLVVPASHAADPLPEESEVGANTLFLPLKINAPGPTDELAAEADRRLEASLAGKGQSLYPRRQAVAQLDYQGDWPPAPARLRELPLADDVQYVVTGSLTRLGASTSVDLVVYDLLGKAPSRTFFQTTEESGDLATVFDTLVGQVYAYTGREFRISEIAISGNTRIDSGAILRHIKNRSGDRYNPVQLRSDLKNIFKMGYFDDVQIEVSEDEQGKKVTFIVKEKEVIGSITIEGEDKVKEEDIKEVITVAPNTIVNPNQIQESADNIRKLYKDKGFYNTEVTTKLTYPKEERVNIAFDIKEGKKIYVKDIFINGNKTFDDEEIEDILITSTKGWFSWFTESGLLKRDMVQEDASRIGAFYQNHGFIDVKVGEPEIDKKDEWLYVTFNVSEGDRYNVGLIDITGELIEKKSKLLDMVALGDEKYFNRQVLREDILRLTDFYASKGYAFAEIQPEVAKNAEEKRVDLTIHVSKGELVHVNRIIIKGNNRTRDKVIRREMAIDEQSVFDATALKKSTDRLRRLDFFEDINITPEPTVDDTLMDIIVDVKEKPTGTFSIGAGYSSADGFLFMSEVSQNNFLGRGQRLAVQANLGGTNTRYNLSFTEPHLNDSKLSFGFDLYDWERDYDDYDKESQGASIRFGYPIFERWRVFCTWGYDDSELTDVSEDASQIIKDSMDIQVTHYVTLGASRDTRNRIHNPSKGSQNTFTVKKAGSILGGDSAFTKFEATTSWYFPFHWDTVFHIKGAAGYVMEDEEDKLPVYEKFYLGGLNTMRGFENGEISPKDPKTDEKIGGDKMAYMNLEYIFPLVKDAGLNGVVFYDLGFVYPEEEDWTLNDLRKSVGFGFRWLSPMGPLRLEWGYNIDPREDEDQSLWDFSIGGNF